MEDEFLNKGIHSFIASCQRQILNCESEQQLDLLTSFVFHIYNRIFSIEEVFRNGKSLAYNQVGYSDLTLKEHKFKLLKDTKFVRLSKLPMCKIVMVEIPKASGGKRTFGISMPVDKVLQVMFLNFLDVVLEDRLKSHIYSFRKGRDARHVVAGIYFKLSYSTYINNMKVGLLVIKNCFDKITHSAILEQYPFPEPFKFLLKRWLLSYNVVKSLDFKVLLPTGLGVPQDAILGQSIVNLMLSNAIPAKLSYKRNLLGKQYFYWCESFVYRDVITLISNHPEPFERVYRELLINLRNIGLVCNGEKTLILNKIKAVTRFSVLGFEFIIMKRKHLKKSPLYIQRANLTASQKIQKGFAIILKPKGQKIYEIKKKIDFALHLIFQVSKLCLYKVFRLVNFISLRWHSYFYFSQGCIYGARIDRYIFVKLRKFLIKKYRYNGLKRPKWVAYNFGGLGKVNPNGLK